MGPLRALLDTNFLIVYLKAPDAIILATARSRNLVLLTRDIRNIAADNPSIRVPNRL